MAANATTVCFVVGARPNFVKSAPVHRALCVLDPSIGLLLVHTGQHFDDAMSSVFIDELQLPEPDVFLGVGSGTHAQQTARALERIEEVLMARRPHLVVVSGDVNSTLAGALAAVKLGLRVAHLEAGLRSFDWSMPEEHNRRLMDHLSCLLLAHSESAVANLRHEGITGNVVLVGNTMIDTVFAHLEAARLLEPWADFGLLPGEYILATLHRPALVDDPDMLRATARGLGQLARELPVLFPVHPRTFARLEESGAGSLVGDVILCPPLSYLSFLGLEAQARAVLTDSGGVQEETSALGVRCFTLRDATERPVTVELGTNTLLGARPDRIVEVASLLNEPVCRPPIPLWDGHAGERAAQAIVEYLDRH